MQRRNQEKSGFAYCVCAYGVNIDAHKGIEPLHKLAQKGYNTISNRKPWGRENEAMKQLTSEKLAMSKMLNARPEVRDFMKVAMTLPQEQLQFITEVMTIYKDKGIHPDKAWNMICRRYGIPTTYELDRSFQSYQKTAQQDNC